MLRRDSRGAGDHEASRKELANQFGLSSDQVTDALIAKIAEDPLFLQHLDVCKGDAEMLKILLGEVKSTNQVVAPRPNTAELLARAGEAISRWATSGFSRVGVDEYNRRLSICQTCEHLTFPPTNSVVYRLLRTPTETKSICGLCGCDVRKKAWLATERCPDAEFGEGGRWTPTKSTNR
jgi:hypothetical protein